MNIIISIGIGFLYLPPFIVFLLQNYIEDFRDDLSYLKVFFVSSLPFILMVFLSPWAVYPFTLYFVLFNLFYFFSERMLLDRVKALLLSIYVCYAVSVLWEFPIQLTIPQNIDAVILSVFRALAIPFFYITVYKMGWRPTYYHVALIASIFGLGLSLAEMINIFGVESMFLYLHLYRLPWIFVFFTIILAYGYKSISKTTNI